MIPNNKNIAILHPQLSQKWWAVYMMIYLGNILTRYGNQVTFYTRVYDKTVFQEEIDFSVTIWSMFQIACAIRKSDLVFIGNSPMQFVWAFSKILWSKAKIYWWHHHYPWYYEENTNWFIFLKKYLEKFSLLYIDELIWNSLYLCSVLERIYKRKTHLLYPIVDDIFFDTPMVDKKNVNKKIIFTFSRWVDWKNIWQVFETYESLKDKVPKLELYIWWIWNEQEIYQNRYKQDKNVHFLWILTKSDIIKYLKIADVFLFPSQIDSFWMVAVEAMAWWVPIVCFWWNWLDEVVQNNINWCNVKSKSDFTDSVYMLLCDSSLAKKISIQAKTDAFKFSSEYFEKKLWQIMSEKK